MDTGEQAKQDICVRAAVGLHQAAGESSEDPLQLLLAGKELQDRTIDGVFHLDAGKEKVLELAKPQLALVPLGYSMSLVLWDPHGPGTQLPFQSIVWQVIETIFQELEALGGYGRSLKTVSLVQICAHDKAWDLLCPVGQALQVMDVAPLGLMVEEATEVAVPDAQAAINAYTRGLSAIPTLSQKCAQQPPTDGHSAMQGAGSLFTLTVEQELEGGRRQRSALRILASPGTTSPCPELAPDSGCLPWIMERLLEGNSLTFLLLCMTLPDTSREEVLAALGLAERVKERTKTISATLWDPLQEMAARRKEMRRLRAELLAGADLSQQKMVVAQLRGALQELKVLKSQRWEKKQVAVKTVRASQMHLSSNTDRVSTQNMVLVQQPVTSVPLTSLSLEPAGPGCGDRCTPHAWVAEMWARSVASHGPGAHKSCWGQGSQAPVSAEQGLLEEPSPRQAPQQWPLTGSDKAGSWCWPCPSLEVQCALAKAQRQRLWAQHCRLLQQELGHGTVPGLEESREWDPTRWHQEAAALGLSLEVARREWEAAKWDLEASLQSHRQEMQVIRDQQRLAEEQREALDRRHQELQQKVSRLTTHNQQLQEAQRLSSANAATQTP